MQYLALIYTDPTVTPPMGRQHERRSTWLSRAACARRVR